MAMSICQGGNGFPFLAEAIFTYMATGEYTNICVNTEDIPGNLLKTAIQKVIFEVYLLFSVLL